MRERGAVHGQPRRARRGRGASAIWLVRRYGAGIAGFLLATVDMRALFRHILLRRGPRLVPHLARAASRDPRLVGRMLESLRYPGTRGGEPAGPSGGATPPR